MKISRPSFSGFTLIELLVVIAIIGLLSTLAIVALGSARQKSRDARRLADVKQIQTALEMYNNEVGTYPVSSTTILLGDTAHACLGSSGFGSAGSCTGQYINFPKDPSGGYYTYSGAGTDYLVSASLEGIVNNLSGAISAQPNEGIINSYNSKYGLLTWWKLDEGTGSVAQDSAGNFINGALFGTQSGSSSYYAAGRVGPWSVYFNGSNNYITSTFSNRDFTDGGTIAAWINMQKISTGGLELFDLRNPAGVLVGYAYVIGPVVELNLGRRTGGVFDHLAMHATEPTIPYGEWHHVAYVYKSGFAGIYVDGVLSASTNAMVGKLDIINGILINVRHEHKGNVDNVRVYNRVLSAEEIKAIYDSEK